MPHLLVKLGFLTMKSAAKATAVAMDQKAGQGYPEQVKVHVAVSAMGVLKSPLISRDVICAQLEEDDEAAFLRCEEVRRRQRNTHVSVSNRLHPPLEPAPPRIPHLPVLLLPLAHLSLPPYASHLTSLARPPRGQFLFDPLIYADAYDKVQQLRQMGKTDEINVSFALRESSSGQTIGVARVPLMAILEEHVEKQ